MKITIDSNFRIQNSFEPPLQLELEGSEQGLQDILQKLTDMHPPLKFIEHGEMGDDLHHLYLNGESHFSFSEGLKTKIKDGDTILVEAYLEPLDGH
ncbi:hypothetical protein DESC_780445 [Desulfosarcina cetonica]|uniref:hypothetical protein n=1 Tax=Desulfosarcina cetonica TaxID=90730 RepID=UPI0006D19704|nr:hypothetical protein [Desulfosarcina cetonica]VTR70257.1 hypothetical protein DESC_780445 [Desulfosarcina cetonica]